MLLCESPALTHPRAWFGDGIKIEISKYTFLVFLRIPVFVRLIYFPGVQDGCMRLRSQEAREPPPPHPPPWPGSPAAANGCELR